MITKIKFNDKYKQFKQTELPEDLKKYNLFYGMNGTGKSTLSRLFYILEEYQKNPSEFNVSDDVDILNVQLTYENTIIDWNNLAEFYQHDVSVRVFNQEYIRRTINTRESTECDAIFVFGGDNQTLKEEHKVLEQQKQELENQRQIKVESKNQSTNPSFDLSHYARKIREELNQLTNPTELIKSSDLRSDHLENFLKNKRGVISTEQKKDACIKVIKNNKGYTDLNAPKIDIDINSLISDTKAFLEQTVESQTIERLEQSQQLKKWVGEGYLQFSKNDENFIDTCPFCEQSIMSDFWNTLSNAFTDQQAEFSKNIQGLIEAILAKKNHISNISIIDSSQIYPTIDNTLDTIKNFQSAINSIKQILDNLLTKLEEKKDCLGRSLEIDIQYDNTNLPFITDFTSMINHHNDKIKDSKTNFQVAKTQLLHHEIASIQGVYDKYIAEKHTYDSLMSRIDRELADIDNNINTKSIEIGNKYQEIKRQNTNIKQINNALHTYMGHKSIEFIVAGIDDNITFKLVRLDENEHSIDDNRPVFLSEGEITLVAFTYFIYQLENKTDEEQQNKYLIVIDDPITSMDSNYVFFITQYIKTIIEKDADTTITDKPYSINQIIFLTHHFMFFREIWSILHTTFSNIPSKYQGYFSGYMLKRNNTNLVIDTIPTLYTKHQTEYFYLFQQLYNITKSLKEQNTEDNYTITYHAPNIARKLLEQFSLFKYGVKEIANLKDKINKNDESILNSNNPTQMVDWECIYRYVNEFSHNKVIHEERDFTHMNYSEPQLIMNLIKHLDSVHYNSMVTLVANDKD